MHDKAEAKCRPGERFVMSPANGQTGQVGTSEPEALGAASSALAESFAKRRDRRNSEDSRHPAPPKVLRERSTSFGQSRMRYPPSECKNGAIDNVPER